MKTIDLYFSIIRDVRYNLMMCNDIRLSDFEPDSKGYDLMVAFNAAANKLSDLISVMEYETKR